MPAATYIPYLARYLKFTQEFYKTIRIDDATQNQAAEIARDAAPPDATAFELYCILGKMLMFKGTYRV